MGGDCRLAIWLSLGAGSCCLASFRGLFPAQSRPVAFLIYCRCTIFRPVLVRTCVGIVRRCGRACPGLFFLFLRRGSLRLPPRSLGSWRCSSTSVRIRGRGNRACSLRRRTIAPRHALARSSCLVWLGSGRGSLPALSRLSPFFPILLVPL